MGSWFSNLHIRKQETVTEETVANCVRQLMAARQFMPVESEEEADGTVAIVAGEDCRWVSVYSDLLTHEDPESCKAVAMPMSAELHADVMGIACFDSDYLYLNLVNAEDRTDAWVGIGRGGEFGIRRRTGVSAWKKKVSDYFTFSLKVKEQYVCAEEFLGHIESGMELPVPRSAAALEDIREPGLDQNATFLYFKSRDSAENNDLPDLQLWTYSSMPCVAGESSFVEVLNHGGKGKGLSVYFIGPYVEQEEITFTNVTISTWVRGELVVTPIQLEKAQLPDGQWAYCYHDPQYRILQKASDRATVLKQSERSIRVSFTPAGNPRKMLDVTVVLVPDQNLPGQAGWNVWHGYGSKKAFIEHHNALRSEIRKRLQSFGMDSDDSMPFLKEEDFDETAQ